MGFSTTQKMQSMAARRPLYTKRSFSLAGPEQRGRSAFMTTIDPFARIPLSFGEIPSLLKNVFSGFLNLLTAK